MTPRNHLLGFFLQLERLHRAVPTHLLSWRKGQTQNRAELGHCGFGVVQVYIFQVFSSLAGPPLPAARFLSLFLVSDFSPAAGQQLLAFPGRDGLSRFPTPTCGESASPTPASTARSTSHGRKGAAAQPREAFERWAVKIQGRSYNLVELWISAGNIPSQGLNFSW